MKTFILNFSKFVCVSAIVYSLLLIVWGEFGNGFYNNLSYDNGVNDILYHKIQEIENEELGEVDILFLGTSHIYRTFDPRIFEKYDINIFNFGSSAQTHFQTELLLESYLDRINPKLVVYDVYPDIFGADGIESTVEFITNEYPMDKMKDLMLRQNHLKVYNTAVFRIYKNLTGQKYRSYSKTNFNGSEKYIERGFVEHIPYVWNGELRKDSVVVDVNQEQFQVFESNLKYIKERGYPVILIDVPVSDRFSKSHVEVSALRDRIQKYCEVHFFQDSITLDDTQHFMDYSHLNQKGVEVFNPYFINWLKNKNIIDFEKN